MRRALPSPGRSRTIPTAWDPAWLLGKTTRLIATWCVMGSVAAVDGAEVDAGSDGGATVLLFATSGLIDGNLMGLAGADTRCEGFAVQGALAGNYVALLATTLLDAFARLPEGRYVNTRGATLFSKKPTPPSQTAASPSCAPAS